MSPWLPTPLAIRVFAAFASAYFMSYALRSVNATIAPELVAEFGLSNSQLGALSSAYFFAFAAMQIPLGVWLDRYGSRRVDASLLLVAAPGGCRALGRGRVRAGKPRGKAPVPVDSLRYRPGSATPHRGFPARTRRAIHARAPRRVAQASRYHPVSTRLHALRCIPGVHRATPSQSPTASWAAQSSRWRTA